MYPGPVMAPEDFPTLPREADPGYKEDPLWVCTLCLKPVLDDRGKQKFARPYEIYEDQLQQKEPANWYHCEPCRLSAKKENALKKSALGTPCIDKMLVSAPGAKW